MFALAAGKTRTGAGLDNPVLKTEVRVTLIDDGLLAAVLLGLTLNTARFWWADPAAGYMLFYCSEALTLPEVTAHNAAHATEDDLDRIIDVVKERRKSLTTMTAATVTAGATVEVVNISLAAHKSKRGILDAITGNAASLTFDAESTKELHWAGSKSMGFQL